MDGGATLVVRSIGRGGWFVVFAARKTLCARFALKEAFVHLCSDPWCSLRERRVCCAAEKAVEVEDESNEPHLECTCCRSGPRAPAAA